MKIAVVGATGAVGRELFKILEERKFSVTEVIPFASPRSEGKELSFRGQKLKVQKLKPGCFEGVRMAFFDASDAVSQEWVPQAAESGAWVIDNSSAFRYEEDIDLIVPEVNGEKLKAKLQKGTKNTRSRIIAGPNCSAAQLVVALKPLSDEFGLKRVVVSTYQSTSGAGTLAIQELQDQIQELQNGKTLPPKAFPHQIAFNCIPQIGSFGSDGYTSEETKMMTETRKILDLPQLKMTVTAVRVPTISCHGESVNVECEKNVTPDSARKLLSKFSGIHVLDDPKQKIYPMGQTPTLESGAGRDAVYVGRIRKDESVSHGINFWVISDNLRKGAALNAVQIGEMLL